MQYRTGRLRGRNLAAITVAPVTWLPATGGLKLMTRFRVEVSLNPAAPDPGALVIRRESPEGRRSFDETLQLLTGVRASGVAGAASELHPLVNSGGPFEPTFRPSVDGSPVEMVIITTTDQAPVYQDLADYKTKIGLSTVVRTVDWIKANYPNGVDTQETIRNFIRDAVSKWGTTWVLLGGDTDHIPVRYGYTTFYTSQGEDIPTDLYYTDLDGNWNGDGDAVFGEAYSTSDPPGDGLDLYPDVWVGRITSQDSTSARNMVDKTLGYLRNPPIGHQNDILLAGEVLFPPNWEPGYSIQYDGAVLCEDVVDSLNVQSNPIRLYENYTAWPGASAENKASVVGALNGGIGVFHHVGHGYINTMSVGLGAQILINSDIDALSNGNETFVVYAINCTSAAIDFNCIAERFLSNTHGGGVAVVGSTRLDFPSTGVYFQNEFYGLVYRRGVTEMGKAVAMAKIPEIPYSTQDNTYRWTQFTQIYLGDPNLQVWTDTPSTLTVTHASTFTLGQGTYSVTVMRGGSPVDSARVALYKDGDAYSVGLTDPSGQVVLPFRPDQTGAFSVGVHSHNDLPYLGSATVVAPGGAPYLFALSQAFVDDGSGSTDGNGDGRLDSGETVELNIALKNNGGAGETGITATLTSGDPELNVIDNFAQYPDIGAGASSSANDPFVLSVPRSALDRLEAHCTLNIFGNSGAYSQEIIVYGHAPELDYQQQSVRDTVGNGNGNGVIAANEDFAIIPTVHNSGLGTTRGLEARLRSSDPAVTITDSVSVLGALITGQSGVNPADGLAARLSDVSTAHELTLVLVDAYGELSTIPLDITPPDTVMNVVSYGQATSIALTWTQSTSADLRGYNVYRATSSSGPFTRINPTSFERTSYYNDEGLPSLTRYYYEVAPVDSSGNEGRKSVATSATTSLPIHDGFPVEVTSATTAGITLADLNHDGQPEILGGGEEIYAVQSNGDEYYDGDQDVRTLGPITKTGGMLFWNTPAVGDVDRDGEPEVAGVSWSDVQRPAPRPLRNRDARLAQGRQSPERDGAQPSRVGVPGRRGRRRHPRGAVFGGPRALLLALRRNRAPGRGQQSRHRRDPGRHRGGVLLLDAHRGQHRRRPLSRDHRRHARREVVRVPPRRDALCRFPLRDRGEHHVEPGGGGHQPGRTTGNRVRFQRQQALRHPLRSHLGPGVPGGDPARPGRGFLPGHRRHHRRRDSRRGDRRLERRALRVPGPERYDPRRLPDPDPRQSGGQGGGSFQSGSGRRGRRRADRHRVRRPEGASPLRGPERSIPARLPHPDREPDRERPRGLGCGRGRAHRDPGRELRPEDLLLGHPLDLQPGSRRVAHVQARSAEQRDRHHRRVRAHRGRRRKPAPRVPGGLLQNSPNPFTAATTLRYRIPEGTDYRRVRVRVFDMSGRVVKTLIDGEQPPGLYEMTWDGTDRAGRRVAAGIYPYRLDVAGTSFTRKMVLLR